MHKTSPRILLYFLATSLIVSSFTFFALYPKPSLSGMVVLRPSLSPETGTYNNTLYNQSSFIQLSSTTSGSYTSIVFDANVTTEWKSLNLGTETPSLTMTQQFKPSSAYYTDKDKTNDSLSPSQMSKINDSDNSRFSFESRNGVDANLTIVWNADIPQNAQITSAVLTYEHQEAEDADVSLKGSVYSNGAFVDACTFTISEDADISDTCDLTPYLSTPPLANNLKFMVTFNRNGSTKAEKADFIALNVTYTSDTAMEIFVHSCDDASCNGEGWHAYTNGALLSETQNRFFQYIAYFYSDSASLTPKLYNATITFNTEPSVQLNSPPNNEVITANSTLLNATIFDSNLDDLTVWFYSDGILLSTTNNASNGTTLTYNLTNLADGRHNWTVTANDGTANSTASYRYFNISTTQPSQPDTMKPFIQLISPAGRRYSPSNVVFSYNVSDESNIANCSLILNGVVNLASNAITKNSTQDFTLSLNHGRYRWQVVCTDSANNTNTSETRNIFIVIASNFDGNTTNLTRVNSDVVTRLVLEKSLYGKINFSEDINLSNGADINSYANISAGRIEVNTTALPELNKSAVVTLYNITYSTPRILRDGVICSEEVCQILSYNNGILEINLTSFSVYEVEETPVSPPSSPSSSGSSSSGSGGCLAKWNCTEWSECKDEKQTRACTKVPEYCYGGTKPAEEQKCNASEGAASSVAILGETGNISSERGQNLPKQKEESAPPRMGIGAFIAELPLKIKLAIVGNIASVVLLAVIAFRFLIPILRKGKR